jgi:chemotaxis protein methyltransferase CheR
MKPEDFEAVSRLVRDRSGLVLTPDKVYLLESRLSPVARRHGMKGLSDLVQALRARPDPKLIQDVTEAMTTNESLFFRDMKPFDLFKNLVLPKLMDTRGAKKSLRIWSAACSSGQEPYSLAILMRELGAKLQGWRVEVVATDLSNEMVERARAGLYSQFEVQRGLPIQLLVKYFKQEGDRWRIDAGLKSTITFRPFNLLEDMRSLGQFDVVFCRNVLIYFDQPTKARVLENISGQMAPDGVLFLGGAETVLGVTTRFEPVPGERGLYQISRGAGATKQAV